MSLSGSVNNMQRKPSKQLTYQSVTPASNMILKKKWDEKMYSIHRSKIVNAKAMIDNKLSIEHMKFYLHLKKLRLEAEERRQAKIDKDNEQILLHIMNAKGVIGSTRPISNQSHKSLSEKNQAQKNHVSKIKKERERPVSSVKIKTIVTTCT